MPRSLAMLVVMPIAGRLYNAIGPRIMVLMGLGFIVSGYWQLGHMSMQTGLWGLVLPPVGTGTGFSFLFAALSTAALSEIDRSQMTSATGLYNVVRQVCGSVGIAVAAAELTRGVVRYHSVLAEHVTPYNSIARQRLPGARPPLPARVPAAQFGRRIGRGVLPGAGGRTVARFEISVHSR